MQPTILLVIQRGGWALRWDGGLPSESLSSVSQKDKAMEAVENLNPRRLPKDKKVRSQYGELLPDCRDPHQLLVDLVYEGLSLETCELSLQTCDTPERSQTYTCVAMVWPVTDLASAGGR